jgi:FKBP-type peptidyl-prolyl cis-trans isomerase FkpA
MRYRWFFAALMLCALAAPALLAEEPALETDEQKTLYTLGVAISRNLALFEFNEAELALIQAGMSDVVMGREPRVAPEQYGPRIDAMLQARMASLTEKEKLAGQAFLELAAQEPGATTAESGLVYRELEPGDGAAPGPSDTVKVHYRGTLRDGSVFDTSLEGENPTPATFSLSGVIPCFSEGIQKMKVGGKSKLTCPSGLAYGDRGSPPGIKPGATLQFEVQLVEITPPPAATEAPATTP